MSAGTDRSTAEDVRADELTVVPIRHPLRWVAVAVIGVLVAMFVHSLVSNPAWQWDYVRGYLNETSILKGIWVTIQLTVFAMVIGVVLGIVLAVMRMSPNPVLSMSAWVYTWFFRGTPVLVQVLFWFALGVLFRRISIGVPFGPSFHSWDSNDLITPFTAAVLGLGLNEAAYMSEIARAGLLSVGTGQAEAAAALGMGRGLAMRRIILPQAMRVIIPPTGNETISMLKTTSIVIIIGLNDLTGAAQTIYNQSTFLVIPLLVTASIWYIVMTSILYVGQYFLEKRFGRGTSRNVPARPGQRLFMTIMRRDESGAGGLGA
ncbi:MAG: amino acid ABC transporter permease [Streptomyces sp.]|uniref:amino acid ABC transporter permease n=1 Tax=Streptomyces sp. TaxID=1931 RepID=UPI0025D0610C|nr:amino acid ABC transporter permease [Streptomyces sp.]MBW8801827.1 amino acid ABC transporter permease [Streptomyces sp.]